PEAAFRRIHGPPCPADPACLLHGDDPLYAAAHPLAGGSLERPVLEQHPAVLLGAPLSGGLQLVCLRGHVLLPADATSFVLAAGAKTEETASVGGRGRDHRRPGLVSTPGSRVVWGIPGYLLSDPYFFPRSTGWHLYHGG